MATSDSLDDPEAPRRAAESVCAVCRALIGYDTSFHRDAAGRYVHARCVPGWGAGARTSGPPTSPLRLALQAAELTVLMLRAAIEAEERGGKKEKAIGEAQG